MRPGVTIALTAVDRCRLGAAIVGNRNIPQKHAWQAEIVLLTADGLGTVEIPALGERQGRTVVYTLRSRGSCRHRWTPQNVSAALRLMVESWT
jgi:hypothetical protein